MDTHERRAPIETTGISRRSALKKGAIAGGAALWVVPAVQVIGLGKGSAQTPSPPVVTTTPPVVTVPTTGATTTTTRPATTTTTTTPDCSKDISNIQIVVKYGGVFYGLKYDSLWDDWIPATAPPSNDCLDDWEAASGGKVIVGSQTVANAFNAAVIVEKVNDCLWRIALPLPTGYTFKAGFIKAGNVDGTICPSAVESGGFINFQQV